MCSICCEVANRPKTVVAPLGLVCLMSCNSHAAPRRDMCLCGTDNIVFHLNGINMATILFV